MNTKGLGNIGEAKIITAFTEFDIPVLLPFGDNEPYDMVVQLDGFKTVQVKVGQYRSGALNPT